MIGRGRRRISARVVSARLTASSAVTGAYAQLMKAAKMRLGSDRDDRWGRINSTLRTLGRVTENRETKLTPYYDTGEAYAAMWRAVDLAKKSVVWHTYICKDDNVGRITLRKLVDAKRRGVDVELLYDSGGNITGRSRLTAELKASGARVITYRPFIPHMLRYFSNAMDWRLSPGLRNHRKVLVVDDEVAFVGGLNVGDDYAETTVGGNGRFRDTMCAVRGPAVKHLIEVCRDTVQNQEGAELHHSASGKSWRQWARRVAPYRQRYAVYLQPEMRRARALARRQIDRARRATASGKASAALAASRLRTAAVRPSDLPPPVPEDAGDAAGASRPTTSIRRRRIEAALRGLARSVASSARELREAPPGDRRAVAQAKAVDVTVRFRAAFDKIRRRIRGGSHIHRGAPIDADEDATVEAATKRFPRFAPRHFSKAELERPEDGAGMLDAAAAAAVGPACVSQTANGVAPPQAPKEGERPEGYEPLDTEVPLSRPSDVDIAQVLMCNPHTRDWSLQRALWIATREAHRRVWVTTPYFLPNWLLFRAVLQAARAGVDVRIVAGSSTTTDPWFMWYASQYVRHRLLAAGVKVYEFDGGKIMHAKTVVVDRRWAMIGSYNWDILSNKLLEAGVAAYDRQFARTMEEHFLQDLAMSKRVTFDDYASRPLHTRIACAFFYYGVWLSELFTFRGYRDPDLRSPMGANLDQ